MNSQTKILKRDLQISTTTTETGTTLKQIATLEENLIMEPEY